MVSFEIIINYRGNPTERVKYWKEVRKKWQAKEGILPQVSFRPSIHFILPIYGYYSYLLLLILNNSFLGSIRGGQTRLQGRVALFAYLSISPSIHPSIHLSIHPSIHLVSSSSHRPSVAVHVLSLWAAVRCS